MERQTSFKGICLVISAFVWPGRFRRLAFDECQTRAQSLLTEKVCHHLAAGELPSSTWLTVWVLAEVAS